MKKKRKILGIIAIVFVLLSVFSYSFLSANIECDGEDISAICSNGRDELYFNQEFKNLWDYIEVTHPISQSFRWLGWLIIQGLSTLLNGLESVTSDVYDIMVRFLNTIFMAQIIDNMNIIAVSLITILIVIVGISFYLGKEKDIKKPLMNIVLVIGTIGLSTSLFEFGFKFVPAMSSSFGVDTDVTFADELLLNSIVDIEYYYQNLKDGQDPDKKNNLTLNELHYFDVNLQANEKTFNRKITGYDDVNDVPVLKKYDSKGFFGFGAEYIYRYRVNFWEIIVQLVLLFVLLCVLYYKQIRHILELGVAQIFYNLIAVWGIWDISKVKALLGVIGKTFLSIVMLNFSLYYYLKFSAFITIAPVNFIVKILFMVANFGFATGSSLVISTLFGVQNELGANFTNTYFKARALGRLGKSIGRVATAPMRAFNQYAMPSIMQGVGAKSGSDIAGKRAGFLNSNAQYSDYDGKRDQKYFASDYQMQDVGSDNKFLQTMAQKTGLNKHFDTFNEARRNAYEQKFPTSKTSSRLARQNEELQKQQEAIYRDYGSNYGMDGAFKQTDIQMRESFETGFAEYNEQAGYQATFDKYGSNMNADEVRTAERNAEYEKDQADMKAIYKRELRDETIRQNMERHAQSISGNYEERQRRTFNKMYGVEQTNNYYKAKNREFSDKEKKIAKINWSDVLDDE